MSIQDVINYWTMGAKDAFETARDLMKSQKYNFALFFCHLTLEKTLKAKIVAKTKKPPSPIHDLLRLAEEAEINITESMREQLREINTFNIEARYDDYKLRFYKKANQEYAQKWFNNANELQVWIEKN